MSEECWLNLKSSEILHFCHRNFSRDLRIESIVGVIGSWGSIGEGYSGIKCRFTDQAPQV